MDQDVAMAWLKLQEAGADPLEVARACEIIKSFSDARQLSAIQDLYSEAPPDFDPTGRMVDPNPAEIATALRWTPATAQRRADLAQDLTADLECVHDALRRGMIDLAKAREIANGTCELDANLRGPLAEQACDYAARHTTGQLRAWLAQRLSAIDPEASRQRRKKARALRRVWIQAESDGMATLSAYLTAEEAQACYNSIKGAVDNHEGSIDAARADQLVALITGTEIGSPVAVQVIITDNGTKLAGYGPLSPEHASSLCENAMRFRLQRPEVTAGYRPGVRLTRWVRTRDGHCRFPGCRRPAAACDLDHITPYPTGTTDESNLACLCRYHHRLKTHTSWNVQRHPDQTLQWTSPKGRVYFTFPDDP